MLWRVGASKSPQQRGNWPFGQQVKFTGRIRGYCLCGRRLGLVCAVDAKFRFQTIVDNIAGVRMAQIFTVLHAARIVGALHKINWDIIYNLEENFKQFLGKNVVTYNQIGEMAFG